MPINKVRLNREISAHTVRLIGLDGEQMGIVSLAQAMAAAQDSGYDLAEIAPGANPPVVKILDWGKYRYEQTKQLQKSRRNQKTVEVKQIKLGLKIGEHDLQVKLDRARQFLAEGQKVKISLLFRGREITHPDLGYQLLARVSERLNDAGDQEQNPQLAGKELSTVLGPKRDAKTQDPQRDGQEN